MDQVKERKGKVHSNQQTRAPSPLIPESTLDAASQRIFLISLFVLAQAWKIYDLYILRNDELRKVLLARQTFHLISPEAKFLVKYCLIDGLLILANYILNVPRLTFGALTSFVIALSFCTIDFVLAFSIGLPIISFGIPSLLKQLTFSRELAINENYVDPLIDQSSHFKGKKTLRFAPDSSIKMNPFEESFCLQAQYKKTIEIPIVYETPAGLKLLQIRYKDLNNGISLLNYTSSDLKRLFVKNMPLNGEYDPAANDYHMLKLPIERPGSYSIKLAIDGKGKQIKQQRTMLIIPVCPEASFNDEQTSDRCVGEPLGDLSINVLGVPPFTLYYEEEINGELSHVPKSILVPEEEDFYSPLLSKELYTGQKPKSLPRFSKVDLKDISWAKSRSIDVSIGKRTIEKSGSYIYTISKVIDGFGNIVEYVPDGSDSSTFRSVKSHPLPTVSLVNAEPDLPILLEHEKYLEVKLKQVPCVSCEVPYTVVFKYVPEEDGTTDQKSEVFSKVFDFKTPARILATKPGTYSIETASSKYCGCKLGTSTLSISQAKTPSVDIGLERIVDKCVGTTGFKFNFDFVGSAPFRIGYQISRLDPSNPERTISLEKKGSIYSESTVNEYEFDPPSEGSFAIEFLSLSDKYYRDKVKFVNHEHRYVTYFKQRPKAYFSRNNKVQRISACNGGNANMSLYLEGKPPFDVTYSLISPDYEIKSYQLRNITDSVTFLTTPALNKGGEYVLSLRNVSDSSSCPVDFKGQEVHINVRNDVPQLDFSSTSNYSLVQGKLLSVPLKLDSDHQIDLTYMHTALNGNKKTRTSTINPVDGLSVTEEGIYSLLSFHQDGCPGKVGDADHISVKYLDKPTISLINKRDKPIGLNADTFKVKEICENSDGVINLRASGVGPFVIQYSVKYPNGVVEQKRQQQPNRNFALQLKTSESGKYVWTIHGIYDSIYTEEILNSLERKGIYHFKPIQIESVVNSLPQAIIVNKKDDFQTCISALDSEKDIMPIQLSLSGKLPIDVKFTIVHDQEIKRESVWLRHLETRTVNVNALYKYLNLGTYYISVSEVRDANGCVFTDVSDEKLTIQVNDVPKIRHLIEESSVISDHGQSKLEKADAEGGDDVNYYCVGDYINYMLSGVPPFTIYYEFNGQKQVVNIKSNYFRRRAPESGELNILAVSDSSSKNCIANFTGKAKSDLRAEVFDLPSVEIDSGESDEEDIYEGDQANITLRFIGHAPFKVTYVRKDLSEEGKIVETEVIDNIMEDQYQFSANMEGTYEAIEIQDAYCIARNNQI